MRCQSISRRALRRGFTLLEAVIASTILALAILAVAKGMRVETNAVKTMTANSNNERNVQEVLGRIEDDLLAARGAIPASWLTGAAGTGADDIVVSSTAGFPDVGTLLLGRGTASEERIDYASMNPTTNTFTTVTRGIQCTTDVPHALSDEVLWAGLATPIEDQVAPPAGTWDGRSLELGGPTFFRGDGTGFSYRIPTDPAGGRTFLVDGEVTWGATVAGTPTLNGWSALYFSPVLTITETQANNDLNSDGDQNDTFDLGKLRQRSWDAVNAGAGTTDVGLSPAFVMQERCNWGGDLDGDGFDDPIFLWSDGPRKLHVRLFLLVQSGERTTVRRARSVLFLRNDPD